MQKVFEEIYSGNNGMDFVNERLNVSRFIQPIAFAHTRSL